jgi:hypothetical protein
MFFSIPGWLFFSGLFALAAPFEYEQERVNIPYPASNAWKVTARALLCLFILDLHFPRLQFAHHAPAKIALRANSLIRPLPWQPGD